MTKVSWIDKGVYAVILDEQEQERLKRVAGVKLAGSTILSLIIRSGIELADCIESKDDGEQA